MKTNKELDKELGIKHIQKPKEVPNIELHEDKYTELVYPYISKYTLLEPKKKKKVKKRYNKKVVKKVEVAKSVPKKSFLKKLFEKLGW